LKTQFGPDYARLSDFRAAFKQTLEAVHAQYSAARVELDGHDMTLRRSPSPVPEELVSNYQHVANSHNRLSKAGFRTITWSHKPVVLVGVDSLPQMR
jgi:hypothetical protein